MLQQAKERERERERPYYSFQIPYAFLRLEELFQDGDLETFNKRASLPTAESPPSPQPSRLPNFITARYVISVPKFILLNCTCAHTFLDCIQQTVTNVNNLLYATGQTVNKTVHFLLSSRNLQIHWSTNFATYKYVSGLGTGQ